MSSTNQELEKFCTEHLYFQGLKTTSTTTLKAFSWPGVSCSFLTFQQMKQIEGLELILRVE